VVAGLPDPLQEVSSLKSKLLQKKSYGLSQSHDAVGGQHQNNEDSSAPWKGHQAPANRVNPAVDAQARKDFPGLLKHGWRSARS
jgi:hypothetical protein